MQTCTSCRHFIPDTGDETYGVCTKTPLPEGHILWPAIPAKKCEFFEEKEEV